ncbi:MAG TPA: hypothetical protein VG820_10760, partial [Fimbriimonadaceae bacterium]|nr:hypothetical protein [Fimbriimonadaceae bacterium]
TWKLGHVSHKEPIGSWFEEGLKRVKSIQSSLRPFVDSLPTLTACMSSYEKDIVLDREAADRLRKANPEKIEYSILYVRSLLQGNTTMRISTIGTKDAPPKPLPRDEVRVMQISAPMRLVSALQELDRLEKKFGTHPLIDYYRAAANASASLFADRLVPSYQTNSRT